VAAATTDSSRLNRIIHTDRVDHHPSIEAFE
jgi:hypothetical protein